MKHYSSGMYVRLGFAVAAHMEPEILIVDEVLAVGDAHFQRKCLGKLDDVARSGRTVLFVTHNMAAIQRLCTSAMLLQHGELVRVGDVRSTLLPRTLGGERVAVSSRPRAPATPRFSPADLEDTADVRSKCPPCTEPIVCRIRFTLPASLAGHPHRHRRVVMRRHPNLHDEHRGCRLALSLRPRRIRSMRDDSTGYAARG